MTKYIRFRSSSSEAYGILDGDSVRELRGDLFGDRAESGAVHKLADVKLLYPCRPGKIMAVGLNYKSHLGGRPQPAHPEMFYKPVTALQDPDSPIVLPRDSTDVHYEGEIVAVIGKQAKNVSVDEARDAIFGVTCGNDVSERNWQHGQMVKTCNGGAPRAPTPSHPSVPPSSPASTTAIFSLPNPPQRRDRCRNSSRPI